MAFSRTNHHAVSAARIPEVAFGIRAKEREIIDLCRSSEFSRAKLLRAVQSKP
jgi:hypothetical protein